MIVDGIVEPMELGHLPYKKATYEDYVGLRGLVKHGAHKWRRHVADVVKLLVAALEPDDVVLGGGNVKELKELPPGCRPAITRMRLSADFGCGTRPAGEAALETSAGQKEDREKEAKMTRPLPQLTVAACLEGPCRALSRKSQGVHLAPAFCQRSRSAASG